MKMSKRYLLAVSCALTFLEASAQTVVGPVTVSRVRTGWDAEAFVVETGQTIVNPAGCAGPDGYASDVSQAGYKTHYAAILAAWAAGRTVQIVVHNTACGFAGRPRISGVNLQP